MKVLIVDDLDYMHQLWRDILEDQVQVISAMTIDEAEKIFAQHSDLALIAIDACVPGTRINTLPLVERWRHNFDGPMIAISSLPEYRKELVLAGCDAESDKKELPFKIMELLGLE